MTAPVVTQPPALGAVIGTPGAALTPAMIGPKASSSPPSGFWFPAETTNCPIFTIERWHG
jgi:hypothetical protein